MKYPLAVIETHPKNPEIVFFDIFTEHGISICIPVKRKRDQLRKILNPHHTKEVLIHRDFIHTREGYRETERLTYFNGKLHYRNRSLKISAPFTEKNKKDLTDHDFQLEYHTKMKQHECCILY